MQAFNWILRFFGLLLLIAFQVLVLNRLNVNSYIHPYVYPMFLLLLPFDTPKWVLMPLAFLVGITIDMFSNTPGMHAAACVAIAYFRPGLIKFYTPVAGYENMNGPNLLQLGVIWFLLYTSTMILIHHTIYYLLQVFWMGDILFLLLKILLSALISTLLITILAFLTASGRVRR
ncbi:MAG: hypothetical protein R2794_07550 [Chitinophagales bacterium]